MKENRNDDIRNAGAPSPAYSQGFVCCLCGCCAIERREQCHMVAYVNGVISPEKKITISSGLDLCFVQREIKVGQPEENASDAIDRHVM